MLDVRAIAVASDQTGHPSINTRIRDLLTTSGFTYQLLNKLRGDADTNRNGTVTFGELAGYVRQKVAWAAKTQFNQKQRPLLLPPLMPDDPAASLILTALPSLTSSEAP
jgi:hypothetical protein